MTRRNKKAKFSIVEHYFQLVSRYAIHLTNSFGINTSQVFLPPTATQFYSNFVTADLFQKAVYRILLTSSVTKSCHVLPSSPQNIYLPYYVITEYLFSKLNRQTVQNEVIHYNKNKLILLYSTRCTKTMGYKNKQSIDYKAQTWVINCCIRKLLLYYMRTKAVPQNTSAISFV